MGIFLAVSLFTLAACGSNDTGDKASNDESNDIQKMTIRFSHDVPETHVKHKAAEVIKEYLEKESDGEIKVEIYANNTLFNSTNQYQNLVSNNVQFIVSDMSRMVDVNPAFNIPSVPFLFKDSDSSMKFWDSEKGKEILGSFEKDGVLGLAVWPNGTKQIMNSKHSVTTPNDVKGLKIRIQGGEILNDIYTTLNASSQTLAADELYTSLETGVVDGLENTLGALESFKFDEVQKYLTITNHNRIDYVIQTNKIFMDGLNEPTRKLVEDAVGEATKFTVETSTKLNTEALKEIEERGNVEIIELTDEEIEAFRERFKPLYDKWNPIIGDENMKAVEEANK